MTTLSTIVPNILIPILAWKIMAILGCMLFAKLTHIFCRWSETRECTDFLFGSMLAMSMLAIFTCVVTFGFVFL